MKRLALATTAAFGTVTLGATALLFVPVLALAGGGTAAAGLCGVGGDVGAALATIRQLESGNNYTARVPTATASGAYQFIDAAWRTWSAKAGYPGLYPSAYLAPPHVQDAAAAAYVQAILDQWHDIAYVPINWYYPAAARNPALMDIIPAPEAGNRLTIRQYQTRWLTLYQDKLAGTDGAAPTGGSCETGDTSAVVAFARAQLGKPYAFAAAGPDTYDCSGLTLAAYATIGVPLPHLAADQARLGVNVPIDATAVQPGDLVFTYGGDPRHDLGHVALAISPTEEIQAPATGDIVKITPIPYARVQAIRRLIDETSTDTTLPEKP